MTGTMSAAQTSSARSQHHDHARESRRSAALAGDWVNVRRGM
jgi:hypothetical protein